MRAAARPAVAACLFAGLALLLLPLAGQASAATPTRPAVVQVLAAANVANDANDAAGAAATTTTKPAAPAGPSLNQDQRDADNRLAKRKLVIGVIALVLLVIVVGGHRIRYKRRKKAKENTG